MFAMHKSVHRRKLNGNTTSTPTPHQHDNSATTNTITQPTTPHQVPVSVNVVHPPNRWPELVGLDPGGRECRLRARVGLVPLVLKAHLPRVRRRLERAVKNARERGGRFNNIRIYVHPFHIGRKGNLAFKS